MNAYIDVDGNTWRELIQPTEIIITRAEGPIGRCGIERSRGNWHTANSVLREESDTAPATGGYDKIDFVVRFADGFDYFGRYDLKHWSIASPDLAGHCRGTLEYVANKPTAGPWTEQNAIDARELLNTYDFQQGNVPIPDGVTPEIVADHRRESLRWVDAVELATHIRAALKTAFPGVKFGVRSSKYSMGSSVTVSWTDGPTENAVNEVLSQFKGKSFDGSDDSTHYHPIIVNGERCKCGAYIFSSRKLSEPVKARIKARVSAKTNDPDDHWDGYWPTVARTHVVGATLVIEKNEHDREPVAQPDNVVPFVRDGRPD